MNNLNASITQYKLLTSVPNVSKFVKVLSKLFFGGISTEATHEDLCRKMPMIYNYMMIKETWISQSFEHKEFFLKDYNTVIKKTNKN